MARIPDRLVQEVLDKTDIVSVIGEHVRLTKKGGRWVGLCPFHAEKSPSFSVDPDKGLYYCFGCQKGGSDGPIPHGARKAELSRSDGRPGQESRDSPRARRSAERRRKGKKGPPRALRPAPRHLSLVPHRQSMPAPRRRERLQSRGIPDSIVEDFLLGYAPRDRRWMYHFLLGKGYSVDFLAHSGFFAGSSQDYPIFWDRLMFPDLATRKAG